MTPAPAHPARAWLGIPYAVAGRFARPVPLPFDSALLADSTGFDRFGPAPPQPPGDPTYPGTPVTDMHEEQCLTLNVWGAEPGSAKPVLFLLYGGAFMTGATSQACFDGARLADEQGVVVVTANYRLGAFGFLDLRSIGGDTANLGLHDALVALQWVHHHIAGFGGDPARVTLLGESAGGGMCLHLLTAPPAAGLCTAAIVQSGITDFTLRPEQAAAVTRAVCDQAGVRDVEGLRALPASALLDAQLATLGRLMREIGRMPFHPCIDDECVPVPPVDALAGGAAPGVTLVAGTTSDEMRTYVTPATRPTDDRHLARRIEKYAGVDAPTALAAIDTYRHVTDDVWAAVFNDVAMITPMRRALDAHAAHGATYCYLFDWEAPDIGAAHAVDVPFMTGNFTDGWDAFVGHDADAERCSSEMRNDWAAVARTGDPGWAPWPATKVFGRDSYVVTEHPFERRMRSLGR